MWPSSSGTACAGAEPRSSPCGRPTVRPRGPSLAAHPDQPFSLVDRTSFAVERLGIRRVAAFDDDFVVYRFGVDEGDAFTLVR